jgi:hypothetical protein
LKAHLEKTHKPRLWNLCGGFGVESIRGFQPFWRRPPSSETISVTDHHSDTVLARTVARKPFPVCWMCARPLQGRSVQETGLRWVDRCTSERSGH